MRISQGLRARGSAVSDPYAVTYIGRADSVTNGTTYTFTNVNIGAAAVTREVFFVLHLGTGVIQTRSISSMTVGGLTPTFEQSTFSASTTAIVAVGFISIPTGTTASFTINLSGSVTNCALFVYRVTGRPNIGASKTATATTHSASGSTVTLSTLNTPANGFTLGAYSVTGTSGTVLSSVYPISNQFVNEGAIRVSHLYSRIGSAAITPSQTWTNPTSTGWNYFLQSFN